MVDYTAHGFASAEDSDDLADIPAIMLELATLLESRVKLFEAGTFSLAMASIDTNYQKTITFATAFAAAPVVLGVTPVTPAHLPHMIHVGIASISATQLVLDCRRSTGTTSPVTFHWAVRG